MQLFSLTGDLGSYRPLVKLACSYSKEKNVLSLKMVRFFTSFRGGPSLSLPLLLLTFSVAFPCKTLHLALLSVMKHFVVWLSYFIIQFVAIKIFATIVR